MEFDQGMIDRLVHDYPREMVLAAAEDLTLQLKAVDIAYLIAAYLLTRPKVHKVTVSDGVQNMVDTVG